MLTARDRLTAGVYGAGALLSLVVTTSDGWPPGIILSTIAVLISLTLWSTTMYPFRTENDGLDEDVDLIPEPARPHQWVVLRDVTPNRGSVAYLGTYEQAEAHRRGHPDRSLCPAHPDWDVGERVWHQLLPHERVIYPGSEREREILRLQREEHDEAERDLEGTRMPATADEAAYLDSYHLGRGGE